VMAGLVSGHSKPAEQCRRGPPRSRFRAGPPPVCPPPRRPQAGPMRWDRVRSSIRPAFELPLPRRVEPAAFHRCPAARRRRTRDRASTSLRANCTSRPAERPPPRERCSKGCMLARTHRVAVCTATLHLRISPFPIRCASRPGPPALRSLRPPGWQVVCADHARQSFERAGPRFAEGVVARPGLCKRRVIPRFPRKPRRLWRARVAPGVVDLGTCQPPKGNQ